jgi:hypothetical protein
MHSIFQYHIVSLLSVHFFRTQALHRSTWCHNPVCYTGYSLFCDSCLSMTTNPCNVPPLVPPSTTKTNPKIENTRKSEPVCHIWICICQTALCLIP